MPDPPLASLRPSHPRFVRQLLIATVLGASVFAALSLYGDVSELLENLRTYRWSSFGVAIALATGNYLLRFLRWEYYLRSIPDRPSRGDSLLIFLAGFALSVTPGKVGELFKSALLYELKGTPVSQSAPIVVAERITDLIALVLLTAVGAMVLDIGAAVTAGGAVLVLLLLVVCFVPRLGYALIALLGYVPFVKRWEPGFRGAYRALLSLTTATSLTMMTLLATAAWFLEVLALQAVLFGLGSELSVMAATFTYAAATIAGAVAMMPGGLGVTEAGMTAILLGFDGEGMTPAVATAATILTRLATLWWAVAIGFAALAVFRVRHARPNAEIS